MSNQLKYPPEPTREPIRGRVATPNDCANGLAAFAADVPSPDLANEPLDVFLPRVATLSTEDGKEEAVVLVQAEVARRPQDLVVLGYQDADGNFGACTANEVKVWNYFFAFHNKPNLSIETLIEQNPESFRRQGSTLSTKQFEASDPVLYVTHHSGEFVRRFAKQTSEGSEHADAEGMINCNNVFAVCFEDLDHVLDEINTLIDAQHILSELTGGFIFLEWNGSLEKVT